MRFTFGKIEEKLIKKTDLVITVSKSIAAFLQNKYDIPLPHVIYNSPQISQDKYFDNNIRKDLSLAASDSLAVYVGGITFNRGLEFLVEALIYDHHLHLAMLGPCNNKIKEKLINQATKLNVLNRLHVLDPVEPTQVVNYIRTADVSVLPIQNICKSYDFCMPNKLFESVFADLPVVVSNLKDMGDFVKEFRCGVVVDEKSAKSIYDGIQEVVYNKKKYMITMKNKVNLISEYDWDAQVKKLQNIYHNLA
jgi:glycosyltransferase involved in cell wall biosynthesis